MIILIPDLVFNISSNMIKYFLLFITTILPGFSFSAEEEGSLAPQVRAVSVLLEDHSLESVRKARSVFEALEGEEEAWKSLLEEGSKEACQTSKQAVGAHIFYPSEFASGLFRTNQVLLGDPVIALRSVYAAQDLGYAPLARAVQLCSVYLGEDEEGVADVIRGVRDRAFDKLRFLPNVPFIHATVLEEYRELLGKREKKGAVACLKSVKDPSPEISLILARKAIKAHKEGRICEDKLLTYLRRGNKPGFAYALYEIGRRAVSFDNETALRALMLGITEYDDFRCARLLSENRARFTLTEDQKSAVEKTAEHYTGFVRELAKELGKISA